MAMPTIRLMGRVDDQHRLSAEVPPSVSAGVVEVTILVPEADEDEAGLEWEKGVAREWSSELADPREDIYTLNDGEPIDGPR